VAVFLTEEQIDDSGYDIVGFTNEVVQAEFDYQLDRALIRGDAVKKPMGLLKSSHCVTIDKESGQSAALVAENVINMLSRRCSSSPGDNWIILYNQDLEPFLTSMFLPTGPNSGELVYMPAGGLAGNKYATLGGYPCMASEHCSTAGKEGDIIFWNAKDYVSINKGGINTYASPHVKFLEDMNCLKFTFRVNGRPMYDEPIKMEQSAKLRSSIITVEDRI
jgi:HK97 family phage major capsid protein